MNEQLGAWWPSLVAVGAPIFPYVGLIILLILGVLILCLLLYWAYRLAKRFPPILRFFFWRLSMLAKRLWSLQLNWRRQQLTAMFAGSNQVMPMERSFGKKIGWLGFRRRPLMPLFVVVGRTDKSDSSLLRMASGRSDFPSESNDLKQGVDVVWWQLEGCQALELNPCLQANSAQSKRRQLMHILERFCPVKPLDGIIVTLNAEVLLEQGEKHRQELAQLAGSVSEFCAISGYRLPLYVVIDGGEGVKGLHELSRATLGSFQEHDLHWLNADTSTVPAVEMAMAAWCQSVRTGVLRSLVSTLPIEAMVNINLAMALPEEVARMRLVLQEWLKDVTATAGRDRTAPVFRGVLLTGQIQPMLEGEKNEPGGLRSVVSNLDFAIPAMTQPRSRYTFRLQRLLGFAFGILLSSVLLLSLWIPRTLSAIREDVKVLQDVVVTTRSYQKVIASVDGLHLEDKDPQRLDRLLSAISVTSATSLRAALAPTSWFDRSRSRLLSSLGESTQRLLVVPRVKSLASDRPILSPDASQPVRGVDAERVESLPAFVALHSFLSYREEVGTAMLTAESLEGGLTYHDLVRFVGDDPARFTRAVWKGASPLPLEVVQRFDASDARNSENAVPAVKSLVDALWERLLLESMDLHPTVLLTQEIAELAGRLGRDPAWSYGDSVQLSERLRRLQQEVGKPKAQPLLGKMSDALRFFNPALLRLASSSIVSIPERADVSTELGKRREAVRARLLSYEPDGIGRIFVLDAADDRLKLSAEMKRFAASYALLMAQPFMKSGISETSLQGQPARALLWNLAQLDSLKEVSAAMREYSGAGVQTFDPVLRPNLMRLVRHQFRRVADNAVLQAARPFDRQDGAANSGDALIGFREQAENIVGAVRLYKVALSFSSEDDAALGPGGELLVGQMLRLLRSLDASLAGADPYEPVVADALRWVLTSDGRPLATVMRGSPKERIMLTRDYIRTQYGSAAGLLLHGINVLTPAMGRDELVQRWRRLADALDAYDKGASANGLYELEQYVLNLAKLNDADDCAKFLAERATISWRSDYFSGRLAHLDEKVVEACSQRNLDQQRKKYDKFASWFNMEIAGHPPFSGARPLTPLSRRGFAGVIERYVELRKKIPLAPAGLPPGTDHFFDRMDSISMRFASLEQRKSNAANATNLPQTNAIQAKLQFRTNKTESVLADQIIDWSVVSGSRQYGLRNKSDILEWHIGEPMEVRLRWAANSSYTPVAKESTSDTYAVNERVAVFRFTGDWSFFDLVRRHSARGDGFEQSILRFDVPVVGPEGRSMAQVFLTLISPDDKVPLGLDFPANAPAFEGKPDVGAVRIKSGNYLQ